MAAGVGAVAGRRANAIGPAARSAASPDASTAIPSSAAAPQFAKKGGAVVVAPAALKDGNAVVMGDVARTAGAAATQPVLPPEPQVSRRSRPRTCHLLSR